MSADGAVDAFGDGDAVADHEVAHVDDDVEALDDPGLSSNASQVLVLQEQSIALELPVWEPTGDPEVDAALDELTSLGELDLAEHAQVFDGIYRRLHGRLSNLAAGTS